MDETRSPEEERAATDGVANVFRLLEPFGPRSNINVLRVDNSAVLRIAKIAGAFPWHAHPGHDEGWIVFSGAVEIRFAGGETRRLETGDTTLIAADRVHSPKALEDGTVVGIVNARDFPTEYQDPGAHDASGYREFDLGPAGLERRS